MCKSLAGVLLFMVMLTLFILPMQVKACDHPECLEAKEIVASAHQDISIDDIVYFCALRSVTHMDTGMYWDDATRDIIEDMMQYIMSEYEYGVVVEFVSIYIPDTVQQYQHIQPRLGCCLHQDIRVAYSVARVWRVDPSNNQWEFCFTYDTWRTVFCNFCRYACIYSRRVVDVTPGCRMLRRRYSGF